jgi:ATP-dependent RNA circularization protein (DNA/RNA ligase family)
MKTINSYSSPFNFGHKELNELFDGTVVVQEKIDGSQISFQKLDGELFMRSRNQEKFLTDEKSMFKRGMDIIKELDLKDGYIYRGEFLAKPKQNTLCYDRPPEGFIILFDVDKGDQDYMLPDELRKESERLGLECVPHLATWIEKPKIEDLQKLVKTKSILGNVLVEGIVMKNYDRYGVDKKVLMGKYVSEAFREKHSGDWKKRNPNQIDVIMKIIEEYSTEARWRKAIQHLEEEGKIGGVVQDIPIVLKEVAVDIRNEYEEEIKERLFKYFWKKISRGVTKGLPEYYKNYLVEKALE